MCQAILTHPFFLYLQKYLHAVDLEDADIVDLADLSWRKEFDTACAVVKIIAKWDTVLVVLYLSLGGEQGYIHRFGVRDSFLFSDNTVYAACIGLAALCFCVFMYMNRGIARRQYAWLFEPQQDRQVVGVAAVVTEADVGALGLAAEVALVVFQKVVGGIDI